jgi:hypothetical protein
MGATYSYFTNAPTTPGASKPATVLPLVGHGRYEVGCADIMLSGEGSEDVGIFARLFYPSILKEQQQVTEVRRLLVSSTVNSLYYDTPVL